MNHKLKTAMLCTAASLASGFASLNAWSEDLFAPLPKHEMLQAYSSNEMAARNGSQAVEVIEESMYRMKTGLVNQDAKQLTFNLSRGLTLDAALVSASRNAQGSLVWSGDITTGASALSRRSGDENSQDNVLLVKTQRGITGTIRAEGRLFKVHPGPKGTHIVTEIDESQMPQDHPDDYDARSDYSNYQEQIANAVEDRVANMAEAAAPNVRVVVAYTPAARAAVSDINGVIELAVAETNQGFRNSNVNAEVSLAHTYQTNYNYSSGSNSLGLFRARNDGVMDEIHGKRDQYGGDAAVLITEGYDACGRGALNASSSSAFVVVKRSCATGNYSFGHELGHLFGAHHNPEAPATNRTYPYGHGFHYPAGNWRTIMSYACAGVRCTRLNYWSNPDKTRGGVRMGTSATHDNARLINQRAATLAGFKSGGGGGIEPASGTIRDIAVGDKQWRFWTLTVAPGTKNILHKLSGGTGDADLYMRRGDKPTLNTYDCRSWNSNNNETCNFDDPATGTWHIGVHGYKASSGIDMDWSYR